MAKKHTPVEVFAQQCADDIAARGADAVLILIRRSESGSKHYRTEVYASGDPALHEHMANEYACAAADADEPDDENEAETTTDDDDDDEAEA